MGYCQRVLVMSQAAGTPSDEVATAAGRPKPRAVDGLPRFAIPPIPPVVQALVAQNRAIYEQLRDLGGKRYPISAVPFTQADWIDHFGARWGAFVGAKHDHDPKRVLTPGQGIFPG